jgi:hypothetical protein
MSILSLDLRDADRARLTEIAVRNGVSLEEAAAAALRAQLARTPLRDLI